MEEGGKKGRVPRPLKGLRRRRKRVAPGKEAGENRQFGQPRYLTKTHEGRPPKNRGAPLITGAARQRAPNRGKALLIGMT